MTINLNAIGIVAESIPKSIAFYRLLGVDAADPGSEPHAEAKVGGLRLMWDAAAGMAEIDPGWTRPSGGQSLTLAFECGSPAEVDQTYAAITAAGHVGYREPWDAFWGQRYAVVIDPDGNHVDLYSAL